MGLGAGLVEPGTMGGCLAAAAAVRMSCDPKGRSPFPSRTLGGVACRGWPAKVPGEVLALVLVGEVAP